jgi:hypothetical protein
MTEPRTKPPAGDVPHPYWIDGINDSKDTSRLVKRTKLSDLMNYDPRASYRHRRLWDFHLGWAHKDYNWTSLASVRRIRAEMQARSPTGNAISIQNIASGDRDLVEWQYLFEDEKGKGRRGSRFSINWQLLELAANGHFPVCVHPVDDATSVHPVDDTAVHPVGDATASSVHPVGDKDPTTQTRLPDGATSSSNDSAAPATPPHAAGLAPASGEAPQGRASASIPNSLAGFDELWAAYRFKHDRAKAKVAYGKLDPSPELHAELCAGAAAWADHYEANKTAPRWRVRLHNWLGGEKYLEDVPQVYTDAKSAAISQTRGSAKPVKDKPASPSLNIRRYRITDYQTEGSPFADWYEIFTFEGEDGTMPFTQRMHVLKSGTENADDAPDYYAKHQLCRAAFGKGNPEGDYIGRIVGVNSDKGGIMFHHLPDVIQPEPTPPPARRMTVEEAQADYNAWYEASLEEDEAA